MAKKLTKNKTMTKAEFIDKVAKKSGLSKKDVAGVYAALLEVVYKNSKAGFVFPGLGKIEVGERNARVCRNPKTGAKIEVPKHKVLKFRFAKAAKDAILPKGK